MKLNVNLTFFIEVAESSHLFVTKLHRHHSITLSPNLHHSYSLPTSQFLSSVPRYVEKIIWRPTRENFLVHISLWHSCTTRTLIYRTHDGGKIVSQSFVSPPIHAFTNRLAAERKRDGYVSWRFASSTVNRWQMPHIPFVHLLEADCHVHSYNEPTKIILHSHTLLLLKTNKNQYGPVAWCVLQ